MIATSVGLPYEIYDLTNKVTALRVVAFLINLGLVIYLVVTKRLFGVRGGKEAYEARLRSESILDAEIAALAAEQADTGRHAKPEPADEPAPPRNRLRSAVSSNPPRSHPPPTSLSRPLRTRPQPPPPSNPPRNRPRPKRPFRRPRSRPAPKAPIPEPSSPVANETPDADEAGVTVPPPLPRRRPHS